MSHKHCLAYNDEDSRAAALALYEHAGHFYKQNEDQRGRWISAFLMFVAFDVAASHILPMRVRSAVAEKSEPRWPIGLTRVVATVRMIAIREANCH